MWDSEISTVQGRRSLLAAFFLTLVLAAPLVFLTGNTPADIPEGAALIDQLAAQQ